MLRNFLVLIGFVLSALFAQAQTISGTVTDAHTNEPLAGATVKIKNSFTAKLTDAKGYFAFEKMKHGKYVLQISFLGFETNEIELSVPQNKAVEVKLQRRDILTEEVIVKASRAGIKTPIAYTNIEQQTIAEQNLGQDIPVLLSMSPSLVATTDAGAGVGYSNLRIRGTDIKRINVTIDGIPLNDPESHGVWWVNMPDFASSIKNIQIQRGVGTSVNGASAFGATINLQSEMPQKEFYAEGNASYGSFNTQKYNLQTGTGLLAEHVAFDVRLSKISSDGFIDRATADLQSAYLTGGYFDEKTIIKTNIILGHEQTYQAWWGVPKVRLENNADGMQRYADHWLFSQQQVNEMMASNPRTYNYYTYDNEVDDYKQKHFHLIASRQVNNSLSANATAFYVRGIGYYETFNAYADFAKYGAPNLIINCTEILGGEIIHRKWLDNDFFGGNFNLNYQTTQTHLNTGIAWNQYNGKHYGTIVDAEYTSALPIGFRWYFNDGVKKDFSTFVKIQQSYGKINLFADVQYRFIDQWINGTHDDLRTIFQHKTFHFINPKAGLSAEVTENFRAFVSFARSNREPARRNYIDLVGNEQAPTFEILNDFEGGVAFQRSRFLMEANGFVMNYENQLLPTGKINNVGTAILTNVPESYRAGIEMNTALSFDKVQWAFNATFSKNKIRNFTEYIDDWTNGGQQTADLGNTDIAFSPEWVLKNTFSVKPFADLKFTLNTQYIDKQYIDNTSSSDRMLEAYMVNDLVVNYSLKKLGKIEKIGLQAKINNIFDEEYITNGWVYRYLLADEHGKMQEYAMDGYFPQAGIHFIIGLNIRI